MVAAEGYALEKEKAPGNRIQGPNLWATTAKRLLVYPLDRTGPGFTQGVYGAIKH